MNFGTKSMPIFFVKRLIFRTFATVLSLPCFLMFLLMALYRLSKIAGTPRKNVGCTSFRFFWMYFSPSQNATQVPLYIGIRKSQVHA